MDPLDRLHGPLKSPFRAFKACGVARLLLARRSDVRQEALKAALCRVESNSKASTIGVFEGFWERVLEGIK